MEEAGQLDIIAVAKEPFAHVKGGIQNGSYGSNGSLGWTYDLVGNRKTSQNADGSTSTYSYTAYSNALQKISNASTGVTQLAYTKNGNIAGITTPKAAAIAMSYNQAERLTSVAVAGPKPQASATMRSDESSRRHPPRHNRWSSMIQQDVCWKRPTGQVPRARTPSI